MVVAIDPLIKSVNGTNLVRPLLDLPREVPNTQLAHKSQNIFDTDFLQTRSKWFILMSLKKGLMGPMCSDPQNPPWGHPGTQMEHWIQKWILARFAWNKSQAACFYSKLPRKLLGHSILPLNPLGGILRATWGSEVKCQFWSNFHWTKVKWLIFIQNYLENY